MNHTKHLTLVRYPASDVIAMTAAPQIHQAGSPEMPQRQDLLGLVLWKKVARSWGPG